MTVVIAGDRLRQDGAEVGGENLARLGAAGDEAERPPGAVGVVAQLMLQAQQRRLGVKLDGEGVQDVALVTIKSRV